MSEILELLRAGKNLALVTYAGTSGISDPGNELVSCVFEAGLQTVRIVPIPGPSAITTIASIAGFPMDKFVFLGFPPAKKGRKKFFEAVAQAEHPVIFYESPYRIIKSLLELQSILDRKYQIPFDSAQGRQTTRIVVGRELTKKFETVYRGTIEQVL
jgi:16S rRNA (cytidine1402-2'-O)-methyltransferase